jgi:hypothetical protein
MKNIWKWILGILLVVLVVGALAAAAFMWRGYLRSVSFREMPAQRGWGNGPMTRGDNFGRPMGPLMRVGLGFRPFGGLFSMLGGVVRLAFFGALLYGAYWLGRRNARVVMEPRAPGAPPPAAPAPDTTPPASE